MLASATRGMLSGLVGSGRLITTTVDVQELIIPGLDGNADGGYYVEGAIHVPASVAVSHYWRPNGLTTNQQSKRSSDSGAYGAPTTDLIFSLVNVPGPVRINVQLWLDAQTTMGGVAAWRTFVTHAVAHYNTANWASDFWSVGSWQETSTNLTSLSLFASTATGILAGSQLRIWPTSQKYGA